MSARIGDLVKLDGLDTRESWNPPNVRAIPTVIALRGIIAVHRDPDALDSEPTEIVLDGGVKIRVSRLEGEFVRDEWERWSL